MIVVIADDLSGAAELANAAVEAGLSSEVQLGDFVASEAEVVCLDTNTRSLAPDIAGVIAREAAQVIAGSRPTLVYKKCDSVLRGAIAAESVAIARAFGRERVLLVPANPSRRRIIRGGEYLVDGVPLAKTEFANDPEHPRLSSRVRELIGNAAGIETPDTVSAEDLERHAAAVDETALAAGGVDFFKALLKRKFQIEGRRTISGAAEWKAGGPSLFVCGSSAAWAAGRPDQFAAHGIPAFPMPLELLKNGPREDVIDGWARNAAEALSRTGSALLAIGAAQSAGKSQSSVLADRLADTVRSILQVTEVNRIFVEGGATASAVVRKLGLQRFEARVSPGPGVGALRPVGRSGPLFLIKPGSYPWPDELN